MNFTNFTNRVFLILLYGITIIIALFAILFPWLFIGMMMLSAFNTVTGFILGTILYAGAITWSLYRYKNVSPVQ